ncbi:MAG: PAS domain S-box protein [Cyanobium sp.]|nr:PAS domain S-box protein [Cyanobium sp.]
MREPADGTASEAAGPIDWLNDLVDHCSDGLLLLDEHGVVRALNPAARMILGAASEALIGRAFTPLLPAEHRGLWEAGLQRVLASGAAEALSISPQTESGTVAALQGTLARWQLAGEAPLLRLLLKPDPGMKATGSTGSVRQEFVAALELQVVELERSQRLLKEIQRIAQVGSWSLDLRRGELLWSPEIYTIFELDPAVFTPSYATFLECVHPEDRRKVDEAYSRSLIDRQPYAVEHRLLMADGRIKVIAERCETRFSPEGEPLQSIGTAMDITAQTLAREQLEIGNRKLSSLVELAPLGIILSTLDGQLLEWNPSFSEMVGVGPRQIPPDPATLMTAADRAAESERRRELIRVGRCGPYQIQLLRTDGRRLTVRANALLIEAADGERQVWSILEDISTALQIQEQLEEAASVFSHAREGIIITDPGGKILNVNEALCRITGYSREQLIGSNPRRLKSGLHDPDFFAGMWHQLQSAGSWSGEVINRARDGTLLPVQETISAVLDSDGRVRRYIALLTDIREQKNQQRQLEEMTRRDALTGLANRRLLHERLDEAIDRQAENGCLLVLGLIDLDGFKQVNDIHGHAAGDHLLQVLAERMREVLRNGDTLARLGGDEFVLLLPGLKEHRQAEAIVEGLLQAVREPVGWGGHRLCVSGSIGLSERMADATGSDPLLLLREADQAMYSAKGQGADRLVWFNRMDP